MKKKKGKKNLGTGRAHSRVGTPINMKTTTTTMPVVPGTGWS